MNFNNFPLRLYGYQIENARVVFLNINGAHSSFLWPAQRHGAAPSINLKHSSAKFCKKIDSSGSGSASFGGEFKKEFNYFPEAGNFNLGPITMKSANLREEFQKSVNTTVRIEHVFYFINPLVRWQIEDKFFHHAYTVFRTSDDYWWSNEKNTQGITLQRSRKFENVRDLFGNGLRIPANSTILHPQLKSNDPGRWNTTLIDIIDYVLIHNCLETYHFVTDNCIHYANGFYYSLTERYASK